MENSNSNSNLHRMLRFKMENQRRLKNKNSANICLCLGQKQIDSSVHMVSWVVWSNDGNYKFIRNYFWENDITPFHTTTQN